MPIQTTDWTLDGKRILRANPSKYPQAAGRANSYWCPIGGEPGRAWVLLRRRDAQEIVDKGNTYHELAIGATGAGNTGQVSFPGLVITDSRNVSGGEQKSDDAAHLVALADRRILAQRMSSVEASYNLQQPLPVPAHPIVAADCFSDTLNSSALWTWETMLSDLWGNVSSFLGSWPGMATGGAITDQFPKNMVFSGVNAWQAINEALWFQRRNVAVYNPVADSFTIGSLWQNATGTDITTGTPTGLEEQSEANFLLMDGDFLAARKATMPATIYVHFLKQPLAELKDTTDRMKNWLRSDTVITVTLTTNLPGAVSGTAVSIWDSMPIVTDYNGDPDDVADQKERAESAAKSWLADFGIWPGGAVTYSDSTTGSIPTPYVFLAPYHKIFQGLPQAFRPNVLRKAMIWRDFGDGTMVETAWMHGLPKPIQPGPIDGQMMESTVEVGRPPDWRGRMRNVHWEMSGRIRFELTTDLSGGGTATAKLVTYDGAAYSAGTDTFTVTDFTGTFVGVTGDRGYAQYWNDLAGYEVTQLEC